MDNGMYGKMFVQMYDGTLTTRGPWQALVTFQQMITLADAQGVVDMTAEAISRRTTIPIEIINIGIESLEQPDHESRTPTLEGRRIVRLSETRIWGWQLVNYEQYRVLRSQDDRREYMRTYQQNRRKNAKQNNDVNLDVNKRNKSKQSNLSSKQYAVSNKNLKPSCASSDARFDEFWTAYPKKRYKGTAEKEWAKIKPDMDTISIILAGLATAKQSTDWNKDSGKWIPHPAKWLNAKGWLDERQQEYLGGVVV